MPFRQLAEVGLNHTIRGGNWMSWDMNKLDI